MSKKGGKSTPSKGEKGDKTRTTPTNELVPGILDNEWVLFQEKEQRDDIVTDVLGEIIDESLNIILQRHIDRIAVHKAVKDVTQILSDSLKLYFISHDQEKLGSGNLADIESHDLPPASSTTDSWSRGRVNVVKRINHEIQSRSQSRVSAGINVAFPPSTIGDTDSNGMMAPSARPNILEHQEERTYQEHMSRANTERTDETLPTVKSMQKQTEETNITRTKNFRRYTGRVKSANLKNITTPLDKAEETMLKSKMVPERGTGVPSSFNAMWKVMHNRPSNRDLVQFDADGNVSSISKIPSKALPKLQKTRPNIRIEDIKKIPKKNSKEKSQKHQNYKIASLRPISASQLSQPQTFELASGVKLIQGEYDASSVRSVTSTNQKLEPIRIIQNAPFDASHIVNAPETTY